MPLLSHGVTDVGTVRSHNEDRILRNDVLGLYVVCDGVGGRRRGELAAEIAADTLARFIDSSRNPMDVTWPYGFHLQHSLAANRLLTAAKLANRQVWRRSEQSLDCLGMGTTITAVLIDGADAAVVNVGDSRAYLCRGGALRQLTVDDTIDGASRSSGESGAEMTHPQLRGILTRAAGPHETVEVHLMELSLETADRLLLCSDGLHGTLNDERMASLLEGAKTVDRATEALLDGVLDIGAPDNVSVIVVEYRE
jgi:PPM family protein phosphatase